MFFGQVWDDIKSLVELSKLVAWRLMGGVLVALFLLKCLLQLRFQQQWINKATLQVLRAMECAQASLNTFSPEIQRDCTGTHPIQEVIIWHVRAC